LCLGERVNRESTIVGGMDAGETETRDGANR